MKPIQLHILGEPLKTPSKIIFFIFPKFQLFIGINGFTTL